LAGWIRGFLFFSSNSLIFWLASIKACSAAWLMVAGFGLWLNNHSNSLILSSALNNSAEVLERFNKWF
jgi:hypothetical protein